MRWSVARGCSLEDRDAWEIAIRFVEINEKDRDLLVGYAFSKERESLRADQEP